MKSDPLFAVQESVGDDDADRAHARGAGHGEALVAFEHRRQMTPIGFSV
jgi:hypothetical protein